MATSKPECCDCESKEAIVDLLCCKHSVCNGCLVQRMVKQPSEVLKCVVCDPRPVPKNLKLVDPSYLFTDAVLKPALDKASLNEKDEKEESSLLKVNSHDPSLPGIHIFVDDSNIWIAAKILLSKIKGYETSEDHRVQIDMGKLACRHIGSRQQGILYGSEPPPTDTVWNKIQERGFKVKVSADTR